MRLARYLNACTIATSLIGVSGFIACERPVSRIDVTADTQAVPAGDVTPSPSAQPTKKFTLADVGLEPDTLDRKADPCIDFYQFACGGWMATQKIPDDRAKWARFTEIDDANQAALRAILDDASAGKLGKDDVSTKIGNYYASCMDDSAVEKKGLASIKPLLDKATKVKDAKTWFAALTAFHQAGIWVLWNASADADFADSSKDVLQLDSDGLGLPDRDYYIEGKFKDKLDKYEAHVVRVFQLLGHTAKQSQIDADAMIKLEAGLAHVTKTGVEKRDVPASYNPVDQAGLSKLVPNFDWKGYWKAVGINPGTKIVIGTPKYFAAIEDLRKMSAPGVWGNYFAYHLVNDYAFELPKKFDEEAFSLQQTLSGVEKQRERSKRCIAATTDGMRELLGQPYVARKFPGASKEAATSLVKAIGDAMDQEFDTLDWMSPQTKKAAHEKLAKLERLIGYPEPWKKYDFVVKRDDFAGNVLRAHEFETKRKLAKVGKPHDRNEWLMAAYEVNAYYNPTTNNTAPAGILQPPFFGLARSIPANMGGIGMVVGHELTHGFDDQGAQFDLAGNLKNWWQPDDLKNFAAKGKCVVDQYSTFEPQQGQYINGALTLGENIADLGGVKMAFRAYRNLRKGATPVVADGFTEDQQFFLGVGQAWCGKVRDAEATKRLTTDPHSPARFRVYGALRNMPEFAQAFQCAEGTPMHPRNICAVW